MADLLEELKARILDLENGKKALEDLIPWRQNELPKFAAEISAINKSLHELREELTALKTKAPAPVQPTTTAGESDPFHGFFSR